MRFAFATLITALTLCVSAQPRVAAAQPAVRMTRKVVLEKAASGYQWKLIEAAVPAVGPHDVLVRVRAAALNHGDIDALAPTPHADHSGMVAGTDAAGDVVAVGAKVTGIHPGERVTNTFFVRWTDGPFSQKYLAGMFGYTVDGVFSDYVVLPDTAVVPMAPGLTYEEAATLPSAGLTAWSATTKPRALHPGDVVLVQGTGGVSMFALQFAVAMQAHVIITSSSDDKLRRARALGAIDGINYRTTPQWADAVRDLTHSHGADLVVDVGGKATLGQSVDCLADAGTVAVVGGLTGYDGVIPAYGLIKKAAGAQAIWVGSRADFVRMNAFIARHHLHPVIDRVFAFEQYQEALQDLRSGHFVGKIVLRL